MYAFMYIMSHVYTDTQKHIDTVHIKNTMTVLGLIVYQIRHNLLYFLCPKLNTMSDLYKVSQRPQASQIHNRIGIIITSNKTKS